MYRFESRDFEAFIQVTEHSIKSGLVFKSGYNEHSGVWWVEWSGGY